MNPAAALRARLDGWFLSRRPPSDTVELTQRNVYIVPTRAGWMLAGTLLVLLIASINYQLNLGYLLTFMLAGCVAVGMHVCHATLRGLAMHLIAPDAHYAGSAAVSRGAAQQPAQRASIGLSVRGSGCSGWADVPAGGSETVEVAFRPAARGLHPVPPLTAETRFPLGTFRVWTVWRRGACWCTRRPATSTRAAAGEPLAGQAAPRPSRASQLAGEYDWHSRLSARRSAQAGGLEKVARSQANGSDELVSRDAAGPAQGALARCAGRIAARPAAFAAVRLGIDRGPP